MPPDKFNSGIMVLRPNMSRYEELRTASQLIDSYDGSDQGFLNQFSPHRVADLLGCILAGILRLLPTGFPSNTTLYSRWHGGTLQAGCNLSRRSKLMRIAVSSDGKGHTLLWRFIDQALVKVGGDSSSVGCILSLMVMPFPNDLIRSGIW